MINTIITNMWRLRLRFYRFFMAFRVYITKIGIKQIDLGRLTMFYQKSDRISYIEADKLYLGPDFLKDEWESVKKLWNDRTLVSVKDEAGIIHTKMRVVVKGYSYVNHFPRCYKVNFEFWRC